MFKADVFHPLELPPTHADEWTALLAASPSFDSPLFSPAFARAVGEVRSDARVARFSRDGRLLGYLPYYLRPSGLARPIGAPFSDYQAFVSAAGAQLDQQEALGAAGVNAFRFTALVDPCGAFARGVSSTASAYRVVLEPGADSRLGDGGARGNLLRNYRRYRRRLEAEAGDLRIVAHHSQADFETLIEWKRRQIRRTGVQDFLAAGWARTLMQRLFETRTGDFAGLALSLYAGDRQVSGHFGVRLGNVFHPWIGASDPDFRPYSPGLLHQRMAIEAMPGLALRTYDLGPGFGHWKNRFATEVIEVAQGLAIGPGLRARCARFADDLWRLPVLAAVPVAGRIRRRLEQIAVTELTFGGRLRGVAEAAGALSRLDGRASASRS